MQGIFPIIDVETSLGKTVGLPMGNTMMNVCVHKENAYDLILDRPFSPQFTPRSKYYATKTIWFCEEIFKRRIKLLKIDTVEHLRELFTKVLLIIALGYLHKKIIGWQIYIIDRIHTLEGVSMLSF